MTKQLNKLIATYLDSLLELPNLTSEQEKELIDAKRLCTEKGFVIPRNIESINSMQEIMNNFLSRHRHLVDSPEKIDWHERKFQKLIQESELLVGNKPSSRL